MSLINNRQPIFLAASALALFFSFGCGGGKAPETASKPSAPESAGQAGGMTPSGSATISGTVTYTGAVPQLKPISMTADPVCEAKHKEPVLPDILVLGPGKTLANVIVKVTGGLPAGTWKAPSDPVVLDQNGCRYSPHVIGIMAGQTFRIRNSDGLLHNIHVLPKVNAEFNMAMPATVTQADKVFDKPEPPFRIKCDVHPWMGAYVEVFSHPYFAVTGNDGTFTISKLPPGTYQLEAWHERLGTQTGTVTVAEGGTGKADFSFAAPKP